jgi:steroid delta-isomerase-like uncharacterized protein
MIQFKNTRRKIMKITINASICSLFLAGSLFASSLQEQNKAVARSFFEQILDQGHLEKYAESHAPNFVAHGRTADGTLEEDMAAAREERKAVPDLHIKVNEIMAERDLVLVYWTASGTNTHEGMGLPATGKSFSEPGMTLFRFKAGKIIEEWGVWSMLSIMQQLGLLPANK